MHGRATFVVGVVAVLATTPVRASCLGEARGQAVVARVIDGETLALADGRQVRLAAALAPRAIDAGAAAGTWPLEERSKAELAAMALGRNVTLFAGEGAAAARDRFGRDVLHLVVSDETGTPIWIQSELVRRGLARVYRSRADEQCLGALLQIEDDARSAKIGLWAEPHYAAQLEDGARPPTALEGRFGLIAGTAVRIFRTRQGQYISIAADKTMRGNARDVVIFVRHGDPLLSSLLTNRRRSMRGLQFEARGWFVRRPGQPGLILDVTGGGYIRPLDRGSVAAPGQMQAADNTRIIDAAATTPEREGDFGIENAPTTAEADANATAQGLKTKAPRP